MTATQDTVDDDGESVTFGFGRLPEDVRQGPGPSTVTVALEDDDGVPAVRVSFGAAAYTATEGGADATVRVELDRAPGRSVTIPLTATHLGGATSGDHSNIPAKRDVRQRRHGAVIHGGRRPTMRSTMTAAACASRSAICPTGCRGGSWRRPR